MSKTLAEIITEYPHGFAAQIGGVVPKAETMLHDFSCFKGALLENVPGYADEMFEKWLWGKPRFGTYLLVRPEGEWDASVNLYGHDKGHAKFKGISANPRYGAEQRRRWRAIVKWVRLDLQDKAKPVPPMRQFTCPQHGTYSTWTEREDPPCPTCQREAAALRSRADLAAWREAQRAAAVTIEPEPAALPDLPPELALVHEIDVLAPRLSQVAALVRA